MIDPTPAGGFPDNAPRLNLGSGWHYLDGFINVDLHHSADVKADLRHVEFPDNSVAEILSTHTIEHLTEADGRNLIGRCHRWLRPGGTLALETPDRWKCHKLIQRGRHLEGAKGLHGGRSLDKVAWHEWLMAWAAGGAGATEIPEQWGQSRFPGELHLHVWTGPELRQALIDCGFIHCEVSAPQYHGGRIWRDTRVIGIKG